MAWSAALTTCEARALLRRVLGLGFEQLGVRENHAELVVQPVEELTRIFSCHAAYLLHSDLRYLCHLRPW